jgi:hypothetical protein
MGDSFKGFQYVMLSDAPMFEPYGVFGPLSSRLAYHGQAPEPHMHEDD